MVDLSHRLPAEELAMLKSLKRMLSAPQAEMPANERQHLQLAVAVLLHEARRADYAEGGKESSVGEEALAIGAHGERGETSGFRLAAALSV